MMGGTISHQNVDQFPGCNGKFSICRPGDTIHTGRKKRKVKRLQHDARVKHARSFDLFDAKDQEGV